jgi:hypothetical protein
VEGVEGYPGRRQHERRVVTGALTGNKDKKAEGRADQRSGTTKEKKGHLKDLLK